MVAFDFDGRPKGKAREVRTTILMFKLARANHVSMIEAWYEWPRFISQKFDPK